MPLDAVGEVLAADEVGRGDRPGVHQRIERPVRDFVEHDRVERFAGRLDADLLEHLLAAVVLERQAEHERLRDRLDAEQLLDSRRRRTIWPSTVTTEMANQFGSARASSGM